MSKREIVKFALMSMIIVCVVVIALLIFSKEYILHTVSVAKSDFKEIEDIEKQSNFKSTESVIEEKDVIEVVIPTKQSEDDDIELTEKEQIVEEKEYPAGKYYIKVNNQMNTVTIYTMDEVGNYIVPIKAMVCSTGEATPQNTTYTIGGKRWQWRLLFGNVYGQYTTHINGNILFHSVPYEKQSKDTLEYWEYDKLGTVASAGCIRLKVEDAKWIYEKCLYGSIVEFYSSDDPGELGKPVVEKISDNEKCRNWDPTDQDLNNPWKNESEV